MRTARRDRLSSVLAAVSVALGLAAACSTETDGTGTETHFVCAEDADCVREYGEGYVCRGSTCAPLEVRETGGTAGTSDAGGTAGTSDAGGTPPGGAGGAPSNGGSLGGADLGADASPEIDCSSQMYLAELAAAAMLLRGTAYDRRGLAVTACAALAGLSEPTVPTDADLTTVCDAAQAEVTTRLSASSATVLAIQGACTTGMLQFSCETNCDTAGACGCNLDINARCSDPVMECDGPCDGACLGTLQLSVSCAASCDGVCSGTCDGTCDPPAAPDACAGACTGTCTGTCAGTCAPSDATCTGLCLGQCLEALRVECGAIAPLDCACDAAAECFEICPLRGTLTKSCSPYSVAIFPEGAEPQLAGPLATLFELVDLLPTMMGAAESLRERVDAAAQVADTCGPTVSGTHLEAVTTALSTLNAVIASAAAVTAATTP